MAFEWKRFFDSNRIDYAESGANVARGHVAIPCPFCGDDPSQHMSVSTEGLGWKCWRNRDHRGRNPARLIMALLGCSLDSARRLVGDAVHVPEDFLGAVQKQMAPPAVVVDRIIPVPAEFKSFTPLLPSSRPFVNYLAERGYTNADIQRLTELYGIRYCTRGRFGMRVIFMIKLHGRLVSWTARAIDPSQELRYKTLSIDPDRATPYPAAIGPVPDYLLWFDRLMRCKARVIVLCEGPFDALKVSVLGRRYGIVATCFFTSSPSNSQVDFMHELLPRFEHKYLLLDRGTTSTGLKVMGQLTGLGVKLLTLPQPFKDPGELKVNGLLDLLPCMI